MWVNGKCKSTYYTVGNFRIAYDFRYIRGIFIPRLGAVFTLVARYVVRCCLLDFCMENGKYTVPLFPKVKTRESNEAENIRLEKILANDQVVDLG